MSYQAIKDLVGYALRTGLIDEYDRPWAVNELLQAMGMDAWEEPAETHERPLEDILKEHLELDKVTLIPCGQGHTIDAAREQWSDGSNTLAIAPGEVVVYTRNHVTNRSLEEAGIRIHAIPSAELSRGRGGPRCMSMPLIRDDP